jgi:hypothetical protein
VDNDQEPEQEEPSVAAEGELEPAEA